MHPHGSLGHYITLEAFDTSLNWATMSLEARFTIFSSHFFVLDVLDYKTEFFAVYVLGTVLNTTLHNRY